MERASEEGSRRQPEADWKNPGGERISAKLPKWTLAARFGYIFFLDSFASRTESP